MANWLSGPYSEGASAPLRVARKERFHQKWIFLYTLAHNWPSLACCEALKDTGALSELAHGNPKVKATGSRTARWVKK